MSLRGLREQVVYVHNPLPRVTDRELLDRAKLDYVDGADAPQLFSWLWKYDAGVNHETLRLGPGEFQPLRETEARQFLKEFAEAGAVSVEDQDDAEEISKAKLKGLAAAKKFWNVRGTVNAQTYRKRQGIGKDELEENKGDIWPWYRNQEAVVVCDEEMKRIKAGGVVVTPKAARKRKA